MAKKEQRNHLELGELLCTVDVSDANRVQQSLPRSQRDPLPFRELCHLVRHLLGAYEGPVKVPVCRHNLHVKTPGISRTLCPNDAEEERSAAQTRAPRTFGRTGAVQKHLGPL